MNWLKQFSKMKKSNHFLYKYRKWYRSPSRKLEAKMSRLCRRLLNFLLKNLIKWCVTIFCYSYDVPNQLNECIFRIYQPQIDTCDQLHDSCCLSGELSSVHKLSSKEWEIQNWFMQPSPDHISMRHFNSSMIWFQGISSSRNSSNTRAE